MEILYIMSVYNIYGGTPKKTLDLFKNSKHHYHLYTYEKGYEEFKHLFKLTSATITEGHYRRNIFKHAQMLLKLIDTYNIQIVQAQFSMGQILGFIIKVFRPHIKLILVFESTYEPKYLKKYILNFIYSRVDIFIYISEYVKKYKMIQFPVLTGKNSKVIYNGTENRKITRDDSPKIKSPALLAVAGLIKLKNLNILIDAIYIITKQMKLNNIHLYIAGEGPERKSLEKKILDCQLTNNIYLLGYQRNIGALLAKADIFVHPSFAEGFGIAVTEAMMAEKTIIVANAGALPELIENEKTGLIVDPYNAEAWANAIIRLNNDKIFANELAHNAKKKAEIKFSIEKFVANYEQLYDELLN